MEYSHCVTDAVFCLKKFDQNLWLKLVLILDFKEFFETKCFRTFVEVLRLMFKNIDQ